MKGEKLIIQEGLQLASSIVEYVEEKVKRVHWTNQQISSNYGSRSASQIFKSGETGYMNPCLDLSLAAGSVLQYNGVPWHLVIEEHGKTKDFDMHRLHFAIEFNDSGKVYFINFFGNNLVRIGTGRYAPRKDIPFVKKIDFSGAEINYDLPLHLNLGFKSREDLVRETFPNVSLEKLIQKISEDNTRQRHLAHIANSGKKFKIQTITS